MAPIGDPGAQQAGGRGKAPDFVWVSSSPTPAEVSQLEGRFPEIIRIPAATLEESCCGWMEQAILARTFHRWVPPEAFIREFRRAGVAGDILPLSLAHRCHIFRFEDPGARNLVIGRPWVINGEPVATEAWRPDFVPSPAAVASALLWVRLPSLPVEFWSEEVFRYILAPAGEVVCADSATSSLSRGGFARVCVRVDLRSPLRPGVRIQGLGDPFWQPFQYENLEGICQSCGSIHLSGPCSLSSSSPAADQSPLGTSFGPWMTASRRRRPIVPELRHPSKPLDSSQGARASSSPGSSKPKLSTEGWVSPSKPLRRRSMVAGRAPAGVVRSPASVQDDEGCGEGSPPSDSVKGAAAVMKSAVGEETVPVTVHRAGFRNSVEAERFEFQSSCPNKISNEAPKLISKNPFAILSSEIWDGTPSIRSDANPGPSKRARPVESLPLRLAVNKEKRKGKGIASLSKGLKVKSIQSPRVSQEQGSIPDNSCSGKVSGGQESGSLEVGGQFSKEENCNRDSIFSCLKLAIQGQPSGPTPPAIGSQGVVEGAVGSDHRAPNPGLECSKQSKEGVILPLGESSVLVMMEDQGGLHPSPQL